MKNIKAITYIICLILCSLKVRAQIPLPLFWDAGHTSEASLGGTGNWDTSSLLWYNGSTDTTWNNAISFDAYFSGTSGTVTLTTPINVADIYFTNTIGGYVITNSSSANTLTLGNGIVDTGGSTNTIGAVLAGTARVDQDQQRNLDTQWEQQRVQRPGDRGPGRFGNDYHEWIGVPDGHRDKCWLRAICLRQYRHQPFCGERRRRQQPGCAG